MLFKSLILSSLVTGSLAGFMFRESPSKGDRCDCGGDYVRFNRTLTKEYICGDWRLGPVQLPKKLPLGTFVTGYDRFGDLSPDEFLQQWWNTTLRPDGNETGYIYPGKNGFHLDEDYLPIKAVINLKPGTLVDRFGYNTGRFISPATAPFSQRALHPANLIPDKNKEFPNNYHVYNVTKSFTVQAGPIEPWFGQPGLGVQFFLGEGINVKVYLDNGHLVELKPSDLVRDGPGCGFDREGDNIADGDL
ncbi:hypothetical protein FSARC_7850 [Fusarium sarcochroum]|uniref:TNT domain-containing protein n=1 Tax=Fusarium sarcochroum TaxID=1208366 RepID=A0A8H4X7V5_9HYPO|nr:hypothetical protein FSARC_7850 [Fusarium sarcochroum]